jgi:hypothetical protein
MRYTKIALLSFGAGCVLGLVVDVSETLRLARVASGLMALGLLALPLCIAADLWLIVNTAPRAATKRAKPPARRSATTPPRRRSRSRKSALPKR